MRVELELLSFAVENEGDEICNYAVRILVIWGGGVQGA